MELKDQKIYDNFFELWEDKYSNQPDWVKEIALDAWCAAVDGFPAREGIESFTDKEVLNEGFNRIIDRMIDDNS